jgi:hypothetical protein
MNGYILARHPQKKGKQPPPSSPVQTYALVKVLHNLGLRAAALLVLQPQRRQLLACRQSIVGGRADKRPFGLIRTISSSANVHRPFIM